MLERQDDMQEPSPQDAIANLKDQSKYVAMMTKLKNTVGKAKKAKLDSETAGREAELAIQEAKAQGLV